MKVSLESDTSLNLRNVMKLQVRYVIAVVLEGGGSYFSSSLAFLRFQTYPQ